MEDFLKIVALLGGWSAILVAVSAFAAHLATERVLSKWRRDEQREVETLRSDFARSHALLEAALRSSAGQDLVQARRLEAIDRLWRAVLDIRTGLSMPVFLFTVLLPDEYDLSLQPGGPANGAVAAVSDEATQAVLEGVQAIEGERPHVGDTLWQRFFVYRAFFGRLSFLVEQGKKVGHIADWRDDSGIRQLLSAVLSSDLVETLYLDVNQPRAVQMAVDWQETFMLHDIATITSGRLSVLESFENAREMRDAVVKWEASNPRIEQNASR